MELQTLISYLNQLLPTDKMTDYCPNGLQVEGKKEVHSIITAVSASLKTIELAVEAKADALIVHHGMFWQRDSYVISGVKKQKLALLLEHGISLIAYHLPLDSHPLIGNNWKAAKEMGWSNLEPFCLINGTFIGVKGTVKSMSVESFKDKLENYYQHQAVCALGGPKMIQRVALVSGGAYKNLTDAVEAKVDAFITGNFDEPVWHQALEERIHFFALGHSATEKIGPRALADFLAQELKISSSFIDVPNPF